MVSLHPSIAHAKKALGHFRIIHAKRNGTSSNVLKTDQIWLLWHPPLSWVFNAVVPSGTLNQPIPDYYARQTGTHPLMSSHFQKHLSKHDLQCSQDYPNTKLPLGNPVSCLCSQMASLGFIAHFITEEIGETEHSGPQLVNLIVKIGCKSETEFGFMEERKRKH